MPCPRFRLEARRAAHAPELFEVLRDLTLYEFLDEQPPVSVAALAQRLARTESGLSPDGTEQWLNWVIRMESGAIAGYVQATVEPSNDVNVAYVLAREFQGLGVASGAVQQMLDILASQCTVKNFFIVADARNLRSIRLAERLGFGPAQGERAASRQPGLCDVVYWKPASPP